MQLMSSPVRRRATYQDVLDAPENVVAEVVDGVLYQCPRPASPHARAATTLGIAIGGPFDHGLEGPGGWLILYEPELHLGRDPDIVVPDLAGWRRTRMPEMPEAPYFTMPPDWVCEVLSPSTARLDRLHKVPLYARERVEYVWLVDPTLRTLEVLRLDGDSFRLLATRADDAVVPMPPFDERPLELGALWSR